MAGYDKSLDRIVAAAPQVAVTGRNQQNTTYLLVRSYNGGPGKLEIARHQPNQQNANYTKSIRLSMEEVEYVLQNADVIRQIMANSGGQSGQINLAPIEQRPHPDQMPQQQQMPQQGGFAPQGQMPQQGGFAPQGQPGGFAPQGQPGGFAPQGQPQPTYQPQAGNPGQMPQGGFPPSGGNNQGGQGGPPPSQQ